MSSETSSELSSSTMINTRESVSSYTTRISKVWEWGMAYLVLRIHRQNYMSKYILYHVSFKVKLHQKIKNTAATNLRIFSVLKARSFVRISDTDTIYIYMCVLLIMLVSCNMNPIFQWINCFDCSHKSNSTSPNKKSLINRCLDFDSFSAATGENDMEWYIIHSAKNI